MTSDGSGGAHVLEIRKGPEASYADVYTPQALAALAVLAPLNEPRRGLMSARIERRAARASRRQPIAFLDPGSVIPGTASPVHAADNVGAGVGRVLDASQRQRIAAAWDRL